ncbi:MAG: C45 family peptidase [Deltaproteobacteria bacterium]
MRTLVLEGTPTQIGEAHGEAMREPIRELFAHRMDNAIAQAKSYGGVDIDVEGLVAIARGCLPIVQAYAPEGYAELEGIARGADFPLERVWAMNALTDLRDVAAFHHPEDPPDAEGCSSFIVSASRTAKGTPYVGQTWDLSTSNLPYVILVRRKPTDAPATRTLTTVGCLSLIGMNDEGLAIGTTNLRTVDAKPGVGYLDIIHATLRATNLDDAIENIVKAPRAGAHYFYVMDRTGAAAAVECTATDAVVQRIAASYVHCNHILCEANAALEAKGTPVASTHHRQRRMEALLDRDDLTEALLFEFLADHDGRPDSICRHDFNGITSNAGVVLSPTEGAFWAVHGPACEGTWAPFDIA